ncbi:MAG TPA: Chromate resistance protein ChrB [Microlunatus sp.]|nr:Chromate resistance protein ChrB [Microlunatus sp.]
MLAYRVPRVPSTRRIAIWRKLRGLGVAQIGDGLVALPEDARTREQLEWVAGDVDAAGGSAILWRAEMLSALDEQHVVAQLQQARAEEYRALIAEAGQVADDPTADLSRTLNRLRRELRRIRRRDYFPPPEQELARQATEDITALAGQPGVAGARGGSS